MNYIGTYNQVKYYLDKVNKAEKYHGTTDKWANPVKHPSKDLYAIIKHEDYEHGGMTLVDNLTADWFEMPT